MADPSRVRATTNALALNPAAGDHAVTADPRELAGAERAGERSWAMWTYYGRRYGDRGRQFTRSDSAWIVTLAGLPVSTVERQVRWLGTLLAARGMPRLLLEEHLHVLCEELTAAVPVRSREYASLLQAADSLRAERLAHLQQPLFETLETEFRVLLNSPRTDDMRAGALIAAAVADERAAVPRAVTSLAEWLADPVRFPRRWRSAFEQILERARAS